MNERLKNYLTTCAAQQLDASVLEKCDKIMTESTIPQILEDLKQNEQRAAELRFSPMATSRSKQNRA